MGGKPIGYKYEHAKDMIKWNNMSCKTYIPLFTKMFKEFVSKIPSST